MAKQRFGRRPFAREMTPSPQSNAKRSTCGLTFTILMPVNPPAPPFESPCRSARCSPRWRRSSSAHARPSADVEDPCSGDQDIRVDDNRHRRRNVEALRARLQSVDWVDLSNEDERPQLPVWQNALLLPTSTHPQTKRACLQSSQGHLPDAIKKRMPATIVLPDFELVTHQSHRR